MSERRPIIIIEYEDGTILPVVAVERMEGPMIPEEIGISIDALGEKKEEYTAIVFKYKGTYPVEEYDRKSGNET